MPPLTHTNTSLPPKVFVYTSRHYLSFLFSASGARNKIENDCRAVVTVCQPEIKSEILVTEYLSCFFCQLSVLLVTEGSGYTSLSVCQCVRE